VDLGNNECGGECAGERMGEGELFWRVVVLFYFVCMVGMVGMG
jgi:hypothetical protein